MSRDISNSDDMIDSRDVITRITELEDSLIANHDADVLMRITELEEELTITHKSEIADAEGVEGIIVEKDYDKWLAANDDSDAIELTELRAVADFDTWIEQNDDDDAQELKSLKKLADEADGYCEDWNDGATLIRESYFTEYCEELCKDIGDLPKEIPHYIVIDWEATAHNIRADYTEVDYDGVAYLVR
jgi:hypothetical protein